MHGYLERMHAVRDADHQVFLTFSDETVQQLINVKPAADSQVYATHALLAMSIDGNKVAKKSGSLATDLGLVLKGDAVKTSEPSEDDAFLIDYQKADMKIEGLTKVQEKSLELFELIYHSKIIEDWSVEEGVVPTLLQSNTSLTDVALYCLTKLKASFSSSFLEKMKYEHEVFMRHVAGLLDNYKKTMIEFNQSLSKKAEIIRHLLDDHKYLAKNANSDFVNSIGVAVKLYLKEEVRKPELSLAFLELLQVAGPLPAQLKTDMITEEGEETMKKMICIYIIINALVSPLTNLPKDLSVFMWTPAEVIEGFNGLKPYINKKSTRPILLREGVTQYGALRKRAADEGGLSVQQGGGAQRHRPGNQARAPFARPPFRGPQAYRGRFQF